VVVKASEWRPEELAADQIGALAPLFHRVWPGADHEATIDWAFRAPAAGRGIVLAAMLDGRAIGARGSIPWPVDGRGAVVHQFHGTCVDPDHRRLGVFSTLNREFLARFTAAGGWAVFNISVAESRAGYEKLGWHYLPGLRRYLLVSGPVRIAREVLSHGYRALRAAGAPPSTRRDPLPPFEGVEPFLAARGRELDDRLSSRYDEAWYRWRFSRADRGYRFVIGDRGALVYVVQERAGLVEVLIGDIWPRRNRLLDVASLLVRLVARERPALISIILSSGHPLRRLVRRLGFVADPKGDLNHGVRVVDRRADDLLIPERWALATADIDTF
jgi:hypothetical protein